LPAVEADGLPESFPVLVENVAQVGLPTMENFSVCPLGSPAEGLNEYQDRAVMFFGEVPLIHGAWLVAAVATSGWAMMQPIGIKSNCQQEPPAAGREPEI